MTRADEYAALAVDLAQLVPALDQIADRFADVELPSYAETATEIGDTLKTQAAHMAQLAAKYREVAR